MRFRVRAVAVMMAANNSQSAKMAEQCNEEQWTSPLCRRKIGPNMQSSLLSYDRVHISTTTPMDMSMKRRQGKRIRKLCGDYSAYFWRWRILKCWSFPSAATRTMTRKCSGTFDSSMEID